MDGVYRSFTGLEVWKYMRELKIELSLELRKFPKEEKHRMVDQMIRSLRSVNANIAEGYGRHTSKDQVHFCIIARGSLAETYNHVIDAFDEGLLSSEKLDYYKQKFDIMAKLLNGYINYLKKLSK